MENKHLIGAGIIGLMVLLIALFIFQSSKSPSPTDAGLLNLDFTKRQGNSGLQEIKELSAQDLKVGTGSAAVSQGDTIVVHYVGLLTDGKKFDSSYERKEPITVEIGKGAVIKGFEEGVKGMKIGGKRRIFIPSDLGYGPKGQGPIPANASLVFEVELLDIKSKVSNKPEIENPIPPEPMSAQENNAGNESTQEPTSPPQPETPTETPTQSPTETPTPSVTPSE